jgi:O-methyltransferase involved in polyketide biosynthesis
MPGVLSGVSKTAILTLRARADEEARPDRVFADPKAAEWLKRIAWPRELDRWYRPSFQSLCAFRADEMDGFVREHLGAHPDGTIVELGAGLSSRYYRVAGPGARWFDLDLPEVIALREELGIGGPNHRHLARSVLDHAWLDDIAPVDPAKLFLVAEGLLYYLPRVEVNALFLELRRRFAGALVTFDVVGALNYQPIRKVSSDAGAPIQWMIAPPYAGALAGFGLAPLEGRDPAVLTEAFLERYWKKRFGWFSYRAVSALSRVDYFADRRSGTFFGRLLPV